MPIVALVCSRYRKLQDITEPGVGFDFDGIQWQRAGEHSMANIGSTYPGGPMSTEPSRHWPKYIPVDASLQDPAH